MSRAAGRTVRAKAVAMVMGARSMEVMPKPKPSPCPVSTAQAIATAAAPHQRAAESGIRRREPTLSATVQASEVLPLRSLTVALTVLLGLSATAAAATGVMDVRWSRSPSPELDNLILYAGVAWIVISFVAFIVLLTYLFRARANAEIFTPYATHRHSDGMVASSWFRPVFQFFVPKQIVDDIWRASHPDTSREATDLSDLPRSGLIRVWWIAFVSFWALLWMACLASFLPNSRFTDWLDRLGLAPFCATWSIGGILTTVVIWRLTSVQRSRLSDID